MKKTLTTLLALAATVAMGTAASAADKLTLQLKWVTQAQFAGYYVAADQGFYAEEGLDVTIKPGGPDVSPVQVIAGGGADVVIDWMPSALASREKGVDLVNIAQPFKSSGMMLTCRKDSGIKSPADFRGKTLGVWFYGNGELGNNGIHSLDIARWALNVDFPKTVSSTGGRYYFDDDQETPDTQIVSFEFENETQITWQGSSCNRNGSGFVKVFGDNGMVEFLGGGGYVVYDRGNKEVKRVTGGQGQPEHIDNLVKSIRANDPEGLNAEIEIGHRSTLLRVPSPCLAHRYTWR